MKNVDLMQNSVREMILRILETKLLALNVMKHCDYCRKMHKLKNIMFAFL